MNITLTGSLGSGKSSVCKELQAKGFEVISSGTIFRQVAAERGVSVVELNKIAEEDPSIDKLIDERTAELGTKVDNTVFDSRIGWNFVKGSFNVFLYVDIDEAARRIYNDNVRKSESYSSIEECRAAIFERQSLEQERFKGLYQIDYYDVNNYNLVIDSTNASPSEVAEKIVEYFELFKNAEFENVMLLNPVSVYPGRKQEMVQAGGTTADKVSGDKVASDNVAVAVDGGYIVAVAGKDALIEASADGAKFIWCGFAVDSVGCVLDMDATDDVEKACGMKYKKYPVSGVHGGCLLHVNV